MAQGIEEEESFRSFKFIIRSTETHEKEKYISDLEVIRIKIKEIMNEEGLTFEQISAKMKIPIDEVRKLDHNIKEMEIQVLNKILSALGIAIKIRIEFFR